ncbi:MAG: GNAT family N-acetyltransferase [Crocinitomicaceae bacterium]
MESWSYINHKNIDRIKYNVAVERYSTREALYAQDFMWDILHPGWDLLVFGDYKLIVPLPHKRKWFCTSFRQPIFMRTIPLIGGSFDKHSFEQVCAILEANCALVHLNFNIDTSDKWTSTGTFQLLDLQDDISRQRENYSTNARRILKNHTDDFKFEENSDASAFVSFFKAQVGFKYGNLKELHYGRLEALIETAIRKDIGTISTIMFNGAPIAMAFFIDLNGVRYYVKGASSEKAKEVGAMFHLIDHGIENAVGKGLKKFDFVGSNTKGVADFNKKFGAKDVSYGIYKSNDLAWPLSMFFSS